MAVGTTDRSPASTGSVAVDGLRQPFAWLAGLQGWRRAAVLVVVALAARAVYALAVHGDPLGGDAAAFVDLASRLAGGAGYSGIAPQLELHETALLPPAYPFLLGIVFELTGPSVALARVLNVVVGLGVVLAVDQLARRAARGVPSVGRSGAPSAGSSWPGSSLAGSSLAGVSLAGMVAALAVGVFPPLVANDVVPLAEPLVVLAMVAMLVLAVDRRAVAAGLAGGLLVLARPSALLAVVVCCGWIGARVEWRKAGRFALVVGLVLFGWLLRSSMVLGTPVVVTSGGATLASLYSTEAAESGIGLDVRTDPRFADLALTSFDEVAWDRALRERALDDLREHPRQLTAVVGRNLLAQLELLGAPNEQADATDGRIDAARLAGLVLWPVVLVGGVLGLLRARRGAVPQLVGLVAIAFVVQNLVLTVATPRLRAPVDVLLCVGLGLLVVADDRVSGWTSRGSARRRPPPA